MCNKQSRIGIRYGEGELGESLEVTHVIVRGRWHSGDPPTSIWMSPKLAFFRPVRKLSCRAACQVPGQGGLQGKSGLQGPPPSGWGFWVPSKWRYPQNRGLICTLAAAASLLKELLKDSLPGSDFFSPFQDHCLPRPWGGKHSLCSVSLAGNLFRKDVDYPLQHLFP